MLITMDCDVEIYKYRMVMPKNIGGTRANHDYVNHPFVYTGLYNPKTHCPLPFAGIPAKSKGQTKFRVYFALCKLFYIFFKISANSSSRSL